MKKIITLFAITGLISVGTTGSLCAQNKDTTAGTEVTDSNTTETAPLEEPTVEKTDVATETTDTAMDEDRSFTQVVKDKFIEGGPGFMAFILICLIFGLAICIERIIYLNMASTNTKKLLDNVENSLKSGGIDAAMEVCRNTKGPVASIFYQGLSRADTGIEMVAKSVET